MSSSSLPVSLRSFVPVFALFLAISVLPAPAVQGDVAPGNWAAPPFWLPSAPDSGAREDAAILPAAGSASPDALPSGALPFFAITP
ncbi:hypothetical protein FBQ97_21810, partial [Acidobacteria bacterium ACD]